MTFTPSPFDAAILATVGPSWEPLTVSLAEPRDLIDEDDIAQPDGMPFFELSDNGAPLFYEGLAIIFSLRDNGSTLVAHGVEGDGGPVAEFGDKTKIMEMILRMGNVVDRDFQMADPQGRLGAWTTTRAGHVCRR